jgi:hypothetical protein
MEQFDGLQGDNNSESSTFKPPTLFQLAFEKMIGDMRFVGMFSIIYGALVSLSIFGAIIGIPVIIIGLKIREAADQFALFKATNDSNAMRSGFELQGKFFRIIKVLIIIGLVLMALSIIVMIILISAGIGSLMQQSY